MLTPELQFGSTWAAWVQLPELKMYINGLYVCNLDEFDCLDLRRMGYFRRSRPLIGYMRSKLAI